MYNYLEYYLSKWNKIESKILIEMKIFDGHVEL